MSLRIVAADTPDNLKAQVAGDLVVLELADAAKVGAAAQMLERAAGEAPEGSLLPALPLFAVYDHLPEANMVSGLYRSAVVEQAVAGAQYALHHAPDDHPVAPHVRHLLLCFLVRGERYAEAMEQVRAVDGYVGAVPWVDGGDPAAEYAAYRALAVAGYESRGGDAAHTPPTH